MCYRGAEGADGLRRTLENLLTDKDARRACRAAAARRASRYSWDAVTDAYERLARQLVARRRPAGHTPREER